MTKIAKRITTPAPLEQIILGQYCLIGYQPQENFDFSWNLALPDVLKRLTTITVGKSIVC
jgi:hypothetical protein